MSPPARDAETRGLQHCLDGAKEHRLFFCTPNRAVFKSFLVLLCCSFSAFKIIYLFKDTTYNFVLPKTRALKKNECQD